MGAEGAGLGGEAIGVARGLQGWVCPVLGESGALWRRQHPCPVAPLHTARLVCATEAVPASPVGLFAVSLRSAEAQLAGRRGSRTARGAAEPARGRGQRAGAGPEAGAPGLVEQQHHPVAQLCQVVLSRCFGAWSARGEAGQW